MIIQDDSKLRELIPNVFSTVNGETPLFDKLEPFLRSAEQWLINFFTSQKTFNTICGYTKDNQTKKTAERIIVCEAMRNAVPSLDVVLTPNGFGVVSNQNIAPASKERVARLVNSLTEQRDELIEVFIPMLYGASQWSGSEQFDFFAASLFPNIDLAALCGFNSNRWEKYLELREKAIAIEDSLAEEFISPNLMKTLRTDAILGFHDSETPKVHHAVRTQVLEVLNGKPISTRRMMDVVNLIRKYPNMFELWHYSETAKLFSPPIFSNKKDNSGYWF